MFVWWARMLFSAQLFIVLLADPASVVTSHLGRRGIKVLFTQDDRGHGFDSHA